MSQNKIGLELETFVDLKSFFYQGLCGVNAKSLVPVSDELLLYSSDVLERLTLSKNFYDVQENGKIAEKVLGLNILKAESLNNEQKKKVYKDVGDTALVLVGYFSNSIKGKMVDKNYYIELGKMAYKKMDPYYPDFLDIPGFYKKLSFCFEGVTHLLNAFSETNKQDPFRHLLVKDLTSKELLVRGVSANYSKKVS